VGKSTHRISKETTAEYSRFRSRHRRKGKERTRKGKRIREKGAGSSTGHKHVAIEGKKHT